MGKKKYEIEVVFSTSICVDVYADDIDEAKDKAEYDASEVFEQHLNDGLLGSGDFTAEAQDI